MGTAAFIAFDIAMAVLSTGVNYYIGEKQTKNAEIRSRKTMAADERASNARYNALSFQNVYGNLR